MKVEVPVRWLERFLGICRRCFLDYSAFHVKKVPLWERPLQPNLQVFCTMLQKLPQKLSFDKKYCLFQMPFLKKVIVFCIGTAWSFGSLLQYELPSWNPSGVQADFCVVCLVTQVLRSSGHRHISMQSPPAFPGSPAIPQSASFSHLRYRMIRSMLEAKDRRCQWISQGPCNAKDSLQAGWRIMQKYLSEFPSARYRAQPVQPLGLTEYTSDSFPFLQGLPGRDCTLEIPHWALILQRSPYPLWEASSPHLIGKAEP